MASGEDRSLVLVTGASGFIATHVVKLLQEEGYRVRGTVRSLDENKIKPLKELAPDAKHPLELVEADLTKDDGWKEAVQDCVYVLHVASPFPFASPTNEDDLIKPAVEGTKRVLQACADAGTVKRVILTSSVVAIHGSTTYEEGKVYSEADWSSLESPNLDVYSKSKILAEKAAWDFVKELPDDRKFEFATINPGLVFGPILVSSSSTSLELVKRLLERMMPMVPKVNFCICDVRDVALAHVKAMTVEEAVNNRHIICTQSAWTKDVALVLSKEFKQYGYNVPTIVAPYFAVWLNSLFDKNTKIFLSRIGREYKFENQRMKDVLGITPRELNQTILDSAYSLIEKGIVKKSKKYKQGKNEPEQQSVCEERNGGKEAEAKEEVEAKMEELEPEDKEKQPVAASQEEIKAE